MLKTKDGLLALDQKFNKLILSSAKQHVDDRNDKLEKALAEGKPIKYSYPKNGLYGLL
ncbi:MAG: hypothetical protein REI78_01765 [Pedobacter sp.]|nr:hypothetical protein [Pedobacter sp.]